jgi:hypothetical protein
MRGKKGDHAQQAAAARRAKVGIATGDLPIEILPGRGGRRVGWLGRDGSSQEPSRSLEEGGATAIGLQAEVPDADKAVRKDVEEEAAREFPGLDGELHSASPPAAVAIGEGDTLLVKGEQPFISNGDAVGVPAEIAQHLRGTR